MASRTEGEPQAHAAAPASGAASAENEAVDGGRSDYAPSGAAAKSGLFATLKRTLTEFSEDNLSDWAAALTYYGLLAMFPALVALVSVIGLIGNPASTTKTLTDIIAKLGPASATDTFAGPIKSLASSQSTALVALIAGVVGALWSASGYVGAFMRASNIIYETPEGRPIWKLRPLQMLITLVMVVLLAGVLIALVLTGPVVNAVAGPLGIGSTAVSVWNIAKWPVMIAVVVVIFAVLYYATPNVKLGGVRSVMPGAALALVVWIIASALFAFFVANFGSYNKTYGALAGVVVLLIWMWITNVALLLGSQLNAERERSRQLDAGVPGAAREIQLEPRDEPKQPKTT